MRHVSSRACTLAICAALTLGAAGPAFAETAPAPRTETAAVATVAPGSAPAAPADLTDDVLETVQQTVADLLDSLTGDPLGLIPQLTTTVNSLISQVLDTVLGVDVPVPELPELELPDVPTLPVDPLVELPADPAADPAVDLPVTLPFR
ncbi:hypothetical protein ABZO31_21185 [Streptomyces sp. HUAS MG47]|uniref:hypothetical protein n=1 Tax=Streptomyces solicamelliae TaxID=3231716 RepID=UPI003877CE10